MSYDSRIAVCPPIVRAAIDAILNHEEHLDEMGYDIAYYQEDLPGVVSQAIAPCRDGMTRPLHISTYLTLDADSRHPIEVRATSRLATAFRRGDAWVESGGGVDFVVVNAKTGRAVPRPRVETAA